MLSPYQKLVVRLIQIIPVLAMIVVGGIYLVRQANLLIDNVNAVLVAEVEQQLGREVRVRTTTIRPFGTAVLEGVEVAAGEKLADGRILAAKRLKVYYDLRELVLGGKGAGSISRIVVEDYVINLVRRADGSLNIQDLVPEPKGPPGPPFTGVVELRDGAVEFTDYRAGARARPYVTRFENVRALFSAASQPVYSFGVAARGYPGTFQTVKVVGRYDARERSVSLDIAGESVSASYWMDYFNLSDSIDVRGGRADVSLGVNYRSQGERASTYLSGTFKVRDGSVLIPPFNRPMERVSGSVVLRGQRVTLDVDGIVGDSRISASGTVQGFSNPRFDIRARSQNANYAQLMRALNLPESVRQFSVSGRGPLLVTVAGTAASPVVDAVASVPRVRVGDYSPENVRFSATYRKDRLEFRSLAFNMLGGTFSGRGTVSFDAVPELAIEGRADGILLSRLPLPSQIQAVGTGDASFLLTGTISDPKLVASVSVADINVGGVQLERAAGRVDYSGGRFTISGLRAVGGPSGSLSIEGQLAQDSLDLTVVSDGADVAEIASLLGVEGLAGTGYVRARITGSPESPRVTAEIELFEAEYLGRRIDYARLELFGDREGLLVRDAVVRLYPAELRFSGRIGSLGTGRIPFKVEGSVERLSVDQLAELTGREVELTGTLSGRIEAEGTFARTAAEAELPFAGITADLSLSLEHGTLVGMPVSDAHAELVLSDSILEVENAQLSSQGATARVSGTVTLDSGALDLQVLLEDLDLARVKDRVEDYARVSGVLSASAVVTGTLASPTADVMASIDGLAINNRRFDVAELNASYAEEIVQSFDVELRRGEQLFAVDGMGYDPSTNSLRSAGGRIENVSVPDLWGIVAESPQFRSTGPDSVQEVLRDVPRITGGSLSGSFEVSGSLSRPTGTLDLAGRDVKLDIWTIDSVDLEAVANEGRVTLRTAQARSGESVLTASGGGSIPDRTLQLDIDASYIRLAALAPWLGDTIQSGVMQVNAVVSGPVSAPEVMGTVEIANLDYGGTSFRLRTTPISVERDRIVFSSVMLESSEYRLEASGYVPWSWSELTIPGDRPMDVNVALREQSLTVLGLFTGDLLDAERTSGTVEGLLTARGTISDPQLQGHVTVQDGKLALSNFENEFDNVDVDIRLEGNRVSINRLSMESSLGGTLRTLPGSYVTLRGLANSEINVALVANGLVIRERNALGLSEEISTRIDAGISATGTLARPLIADRAVDTDSDGVEEVAGGITLTRSRISFEAPEGAAVRLAEDLAIDPRFNVSLRVGTNVWVLPPSMAMHVLGSGSLRGTLSSPDLRLALRVVEGYMRLASSRLSIVPGGTIEAVFSPPAEPELRADFRAYTSVTAVNQFGQRQRYRVDMVVKGSVGDLQIDLVSDPAGLSREQILVALGRVEGLFGEDDSQLQRELGNVLTAVGTSALFAPIETVFVSTFGLEQFTLEYSADRPLALYVSRRLADNLYLSYYGRLTSGFTDADDVSYELNLDYRFADKYTFGLGVDNEATVSLQAQYTFPF